MCVRVGILCVLQVFVLLFYRDVPSALFWYMGVFSWLALIGLRSFSRSLSLVCSRDLLSVETGITGGYHRMWSHRAYTGSTPLRYVWAILGFIAFQVCVSCLSFVCLLFFLRAFDQGSIKWWVLRHRIHHRFTDTEFDPYSSKRGLWFSHYGW